MTVSFFEFLRRGKWMFGFSSAMAVLLALLLLKLTNDENLGRLRIAEFLRHLPQPEMSGDINARAVASILDRFDDRDSLRTAERVQAIGHGIEKRPEQLRKDLEIVEQGTLLIWFGPLATAPDQILPTIGDLLIARTADNCIRQFIREHPMTVARAYLKRLPSSELPEAVPRRLTRLWLPFWILLTLPGTLTAVRIQQNTLALITTFNWKRPDVWIGVPLCAPGLVVMLALNGLYQAVLKGSNLLRSQPKPEVVPLPMPPAFAAFRGRPREGRRLRRAGIPAEWVPITPPSGWIVVPTERLVDTSTSLDLPFESLDGKTMSLDDGRLVYLVQIDQPELRTRRRIQRELGRLTVMRRQYVELCRSRTGIELKELQALQLPQLHERQDELFQRLVQTSRQIDLTAARTSQLENLLARQGEPAWLGEEYDRLSNLAEVEQIIVDVPGKMLIILTTMLYCEEVQDRQVHYYTLGRFRLEIGQNKGQIRMTNLTHRIGRNDTPYVRDGVADCFGNIGSGLALHMGRLEHSVVFTMLVGYLTRDARGGFKASGWKEEVPVEIARPHLVHQPVERSA